MLIPLSRILPNPSQPRKVFDPASLDSLAASIREQGVIQPITVEKAPGGWYILHDGERRTRAAHIAGLSEIPAAIVPPLNGTGPRERLERALAANLQRADLTFSEEARAYAALRDTHGLSVDEIARRLSMPRKRIDQALMALKLDGPILDLVDARRLPKDERLLRALLAVPEIARIALAEKLAARGVSIREGVNACQAAVKALSNQTPAAHPHPISVELAAKYTRAEIPPRKWDIFAQAGQVPPWPILEEAARKVCRHCDLGNYASPETCKMCPAAEMLAALMERVEEK